MTNFPKTSKGYEQLKKTEFWGIDPQTEKTFLELMSNKGFKRIVIGTELGKSIYDFEIQELKTLIVLPILDELIPYPAGHEHYTQTRGQPLEKILFQAFRFKNNLVTTNETILKTLKYHNITIIPYNIFYTTETMQLCLKYIQEYSDNLGHLTNKTAKQLESDYEKERWINPLSSNIQETQKDIDDSITRMNIHLRDIIFLRRETVKKIQQIDALKEQRKGTLKGIKNQFKKIKELPFVKEAKFGMGQYYIDYGDIYIQTALENGFKEIVGPSGNKLRIPQVRTERVYIGRIRISIEPKGIIVTNNLRVNKYETPHSNNGQPCFGEMSVDMASAISDYDYETLAKLLYAWLISYNKEDAYCKIEEFYIQNGSAEIKEEENKIETGEQNGEVLV